MNVGTKYGARKKIHKLIEVVLMIFIFQRSMHGTLKSVILADGKYFVSTKQQIPIGCLLFMTKWTIPNPFGHSFIRECRFLQWENDISAWNLLLLRYFSRLFNQKIYAITVQHKLGFSQLVFHFHCHYQFNFN